MAVCDVEDGYRCRFVAYLMERRAGEFVIHSFSDTGLFLEELKGSVYDLVILRHRRNGKKSACAVASSERHDDERRRGKCRTGIAGNNLSISLSADGDDSA